jgi:hypothetical protein
MRVLGSPHYIARPPNAFKRPELCVMPNFPQTILRHQLAWLRARYDNGAIPAGIYRTVKTIENEIAWHDHHTKHTNPRTARIPRPPRKEKTAMGERSSYAYGQSKYLRAADLLGKTSRVVIENVEDVQFDEKGVKPVLSFAGKQKKLVVNATNFDVLAAGISSNTTKWVGHAIVLKGVKVKFKGSLVDSIQVEVAAPLKRSESDPDLDDDLPDDLVA